MTCLRITLALFWLLPATMPAPASADSLPNAPRLELPQELRGSCPPREAALLADGADGRFDEFSLWEAALVASAVDDEQELCLRREWLERLVAAWRSGIEGHASPRQRARALHEQMHRELLTGGYNAASSTPIETIDTGRFNCVSATLLYCVLAERFGLAVVPIESPSHVACRLADAQEACEIQTTCPEWFTQMIVPCKPASAATSCQISQPELIAAIYYNRGVDLLSRKQFAPAVAVMHRAHRLHPSQASVRGNLLAAMNNWAIALSYAGDHAAALRLLQQGRELAADHGSFQFNYAVIQRRAGQE